MIEEHYELLEGLGLYVYNIEFEDDLIIDVTFQFQFYTHILN